MKISRICMSLAVAMVLSLSAIAQTGDTGGPPPGGPPPEAVGGRC